MTGRLYLIFAAVVACVAPSMAQEKFDSADAAAQAVINAADSHDSARLMAIFGLRAKGILTCGNPEQDRAEQAEFAKLARAKYRLEISPMSPNRAILAIGDEDWPFPVPILRVKGKWSFEASQAPAEMHARRIGANELDAIEVCHGYVDAQTKYASEDRDRDGLLKYSPRVMSTAGHHDGLYWEGESESVVPAGFAHAVWDGLHKGDARPYHGYYYRVLDSQGPNAPGGAHRYTVKDKMIGGFALVAWPAEYGVTGIHTFIVNQEDIAPVAGQRPAPITSFDPDRSWSQVE